MRTHVNVFSNALIRLFFYLLFLIIFPLNAICETMRPAENTPGIFVKVPTMQEPSEFLLGGLLQTEYLYYTESEREDNRFHIRRAQVELTGQFTDWLRFNIEGELKSNTSDHLLDTYGEVSLEEHTVRIGKFKKPFSLEQQSDESAICFTERSIGSSFTPSRGVGVGYKGIINPYLYFSAGLFNTEGDSASTTGTDNDNPEVVGRTILKPFAGITNEFLHSFQVGGSTTYASLNLSDMEFTAKSAGMIDTSRNIYTLTHDTKFGVLQDVGDRYRYGLESAWTWQSVLVQGEYIHLTYTSLKPAGSPANDAVFSSWYVSSVYWFTGEQPELDASTPRPIQPTHPFDCKNHYYGAFGLAARIEHFNGDDDWIIPDAYVSVRDADGASLALNWVLFPMHRVTVDYTRTEFSDPVRIRVNPDGSVDYIDTENIITLRYTIDF